MKAQATIVAIAGALLLAACHTSPAATTQNNAAALERSLENEADNLDAEAAKDADQDAAAALNGADGLANLDNGDAATTNNAQ